MIIPSSYNNLTIEQFQKLTVLVTKDQTIERDILILSLLTGKSSFDIEKLSPTVFYKYFAMASFIHEPIKSIGLKKSTWLGLKKFKAISWLRTILLGSVGNAPFSSLNPKTWKKAGST